MCPERTLEIWSGPRDSSLIVRRASRAFRRALEGGGPRRTRVRQPSRRGLGLAGCVRPSRPSRHTRAPSWRCRAFTARRSRGCRRRVASSAARCGTADRPRGCGIRRSSHARRERRLHHRSRCIAHLSYGGDCCSRRVENYLPVQFRKTVSRRVQQKNEMDRRQADAGGQPAIRPPCDERLGTSPASRSRRHSVRVPKRQQRI